MSNNPINLALRFVLELVALFAIGYWGWTQHTGIVQVLLCLGLPIIAATIWGIFRIPGEPGPAPVAVPGWVRLLLEAVFFGAAVILLAAAQQQTPSIILGIVVVLHYLASYDRIIRLLRRS